MTAFNPYSAPAAPPRPPAPPRPRWGIRPVSRPRLRAAFGAVTSLALLGIDLAFIRFEGRFFPSLLVLGSTILPICLLNMIVGQPYGDDGLPRRWYVALYYTSLGLGALAGFVATILLSDF